MRLAESIGTVIQRLQLLWVRWWSSQASRGQRLEYEYDRRDTRARRYEATRGIWECSPRPHTTSEFSKLNGFEFAS